MNTTQYNIRIRAAGFTHLIYHVYKLVREGSATTAESGSVREGKNSYRSNNRPYSCWYGEASPGLARDHRPSSKALVFFLTGIALLIYHSRW
jgi:hypothetical protein